MPGILSEHSLIRISQLDPRIPGFDFDSDQLSRLLLNFFNNSAEAINDSETRNGQIIIKTELVDTNIQLTISDNGPGITGDIKEKIFNRRFTTKKNHNGYGLMDCGLIVGIHNGQVEIVDNINEGAAFKIVLPIEQLSIPAGLMFMKLNQKGAAHITGEATPLIRLY